MNIHAYKPNRKQTVYKQCLRLRYLPDRWNIAYHMDIRPFKKKSVFLFWRQTWPWYIVVIANENWIRSISHTCPQPCIQITIVSQDPKHDISQPCHNHNQLFPRIQLYICIHAHTHNHPHPSSSPLHQDTHTKGCPKGNLCHYATISSDTKSCPLVMMTRTSSVCNIQWW